MRVKGFELTVAPLPRARCETKRSRATFCTEWSKDSDCEVSKSSCMCDWRRSLEWLVTVPHSKLNCHNSCVRTCSTSKPRTPFSQLVRAHRTACEDVVHCVLCLLFLMIVQMSCFRSQVRWVALSADLFN